MTDSTTFPELIHYYYFASDREYSIRKQKKKFTHSLDDQHDEIKASHFNSNQKWDALNKLASNG